MLQGKEWIWTGFTILLILIALFSALNVLELRAEEPRRAVVAMEMYFSGEWIVPKIHGVNYYNKPPLFNWLLASFFSLADSMDEWVVRLPALLAFLLTGLSILLLTRKYLDAKTGIAAALIYLTSADLLFYGSVNSGEIDLFLSLLIFLQIGSIFHFDQQRKYLLLFILSYFFTALGVLTKGLPALAFQGLTLLAYFIFQSHWKRLFHPAHFAGIALLLLISGGYFWRYNQEANAIVFAFNLFNEASSKSATSNYSSEIGEHLLFFPFTFLKLSLPWSLAILLLFQKKNRNGLFESSLIRFSVVFILSNIGLYWLSPSTYDRYLYPILPFFSIFLAWLILKKAKRTLLFILVVSIILAGLRITYNFTLMPHQQRTLKVLMYRDLSSKILSLTKNQPIHYAGKAHVYPVKPSIMGRTLTQGTLVLPPILPYQIPYYLSKGTEKIMYFESDLTKHQALYYIGYKAYFQSMKAIPSYDILLEFQEKWTSRTMQLIKIN